MKPLIYALLIVLFSACRSGSDQKIADDHAVDSEISTENNLSLIDPAGFKTTINGKKVRLYTLKNASGITAQITNFGGRVVSLWTPDKDGNFDDIVLGYDNLDGYLNSNEPYFGALIGRYGNRIGQASFELDGKTYTLNANNGVNHLHGGPNGFHNVIWKSEQIDEQTLVLKYLSPDGEEGYPGNLNVSVQYTLTDKDELHIEYEATTDAATHVNLTHHSFFNLLGAGNGSINDHMLLIKADNFTPVDESLIPTGEIAATMGTPMYFRKPTYIGDRLNEDYDQLIYGGGYDHNFVLNSDEHDEVVPDALVFEVQTGRTIAVLTDEPGLQFYGGNFLDGSDVGKGGKPYEYQSAFCLETQHFPDSPNKPDFPSTILHPDETYKSSCTYRFATIRQ